MFDLSSFFEYNQFIYFMNGHERRRREKQGQIIRAALDLFERHGFKRVSVSEIAGQAGVSQVTIYKYFTNKHLLVRACIRDYFLAKARGYGDILTADRPYLERLSAMMNDKSAMVHGFGGELVKELQEQDREYLEEIIALRRKAIHEISVPFLQEGRAKGFIPAGISNEAILVYLDIIGAGIVHSTLYRDFERHNPHAFEEIQQLAVRSISGVQDR